MIQNTGSSSIKYLRKDEVTRAIEVFAGAISRHWPNTVEEARFWVHDEFHHPETVLLGHFGGPTLNAVVCLSSFQFVLSKLADKEQGLIKSALASSFPNLKVEEIVHLGGLAVTKEVVGIGWGTLLFRMAEREAQERDYKLLVGHTARRSEKYPSMHILQSVVKWRKWFELSTAEPIYYSNPSDLEKVWTYKPC